METKLNIDQCFDEFWKAYPSREPDKGGKKNSRRIYETAVKIIGHDVIMKALKAYIEICEARGILGTSYMKTAPTFLMYGDKKGIAQKEIMKGNKPKYLPLLELVAKKEKKEMSNEKLYELDGLLAKQLRGEPMNKTQWARMEVLLKEHGNPEQAVNDFIKRRQIASQIIKR